MSLRAAAVWLGMLALGCNAPEPPPSTGGTDVPAGECGRGLVVVHVPDDRASTNVGLLALDGRVLSPSFVSSSTQAVGLSAPLSGDIALPSSLAAGPEIILLDRYPASVLSWVDVATAAVRGQLNVGTGFTANPHDYVELSPTKAYVTRYEANPDPGREPFDAGDDLLIVDPSAPAIVGRIDLPATQTGIPGGFHASPSRAVASGGLVYVVLEGYATGFVNGSAPSRVVAVDPDTDSITDVLVLDGVHGCGGLALSPAGDEIALSCSGAWTGAEYPDPETSFVVRVSLAGALTERDRVSAAALGGRSFGFGIDYAAAETLVVLRFGDELLELSPGLGSARELLRAEAFSLGDVRCAAECSVCYAADAAAGAVQRFGVTGGRLGEPAALVVDSLTGLPPRWLGRF